MLDAQEGTFHGEKAIWLRYGCYEAALLPEIGANLIAFRDTHQRLTFLHEPSEDEMDSFKARPLIHGIPVLFPPNRYEDGKFAWDGKELQLPVNEPATGNHLHGFLYNTPWEVVDFGQTPSESYVNVRIFVNESHPIYRVFPFTFSVHLRYSLNGNGLVQEVWVRNEGQNILPCLLAFHTSINAPFTIVENASDYRVRVTIGDRWELDERMLPTKRFQALNQREQCMQQEGVYPFFEAMDNHYTAKPRDGRNRMELQDTKTGITLVYDVGTSYKHWMIWNNGAKEGFFCPEPQTNLVNAPNIPLDSERMGLFSLKHGELWGETSRLYVLKDNS